jgi:2-C-methyl-D-erythritol 4-phosphate cytidylyltransferase
MENRTAAIILMGGEGRRFGSTTPKQFHLLNHQKIYQHTLETFLDSNLFHQIILVCHPDWIDPVKTEVPASITVIPGGSNRQASSYLGLQACNVATRFVLIHDAVRPFVSPSILQNNLEAVIHHRAVDTCIPSADTIVHAQNDFISSIPPRSEYLRGQTPQTFDYQLICEAHRKTKKTESTDDCSLVLELGHPVAIVSGEESNMKITTEFDVQLAGLLSGNLKVFRIS